MITGIILAGGKSTRMGKDKGLIAINKKPMIQHVIDAITPFVSSIIIISNNSAYKRFGFKVYSDLLKNKGPVGGIYTALSISNTEKNLIVSCDTPFISSDLLTILKNKRNNCDIIIPKYNNKIHPLIGIYSKKNTDYFKQSIINNQLKLIELILKLNHLIINIDKDKVNKLNFTNINSKIDLNKINDN